MAPTPPEDDDLTTPETGFQPGQQDADGDDLRDVRISPFWAPTRCPACDLDEGIRLVRGYPTEEAEDAAGAGLAILAGCLYDPSMTTHHCRACAHEWHD